MNDQAWMERALTAAQRGGLATWQNPQVGAVLVKDDHLLAVGYHHRYGDYHAERDALSQVTPDQARGGTLYVTLEPCNHSGKQPPCSHLIVDYGIKRVVVGKLDPHQIVAGKGVQYLRDHGIQVTIGVLEQEARAINPHYNFFFTHQRPWIALKQAVTLDGKVALGNGERTAITNQAVYDWVHQERAHYQAILVGSQTVLTDNPTLGTTAKLEHQPWRVIMDRRGRLFEQAHLKIWQATVYPTLVYTETPTSLAFPGVEIKQLAEVTPKTVVDDLAQQGLQSLYVEGGPQIHNAFYQADLWDESITYLSPKLIGGQGVTAFSGPEPGRLMELVNVEVQKLGSDLRIRGERKCLPD